MDKLTVAILLIVSLLGNIEQGRQIKGLESTIYGLQNNANERFIDKEIMKSEYEVKINDLKELVVDAKKFHLKTLKERQSIAKSMFDYDAISNKQKRTLLRAYEIGSELGLGYAAAGVCMQETLCGKTVLVGHMTVDVGKRSYGVMQIKVVAVLDVLEQYPHLGSFKTEEEIIAKLLTDDDWNITIAVHYLQILKEKGLSWREMLTAYNLGPSGAKRVTDAEFYKYTVKVVKHIQKHKDFIEQHARS